jgi:MFS family permease
MTYNVANDDCHHVNASGIFVAGRPNPDAGTSMSSLIAASLRRRDVHYGWVVVGVTFFTMLVTAGALGTPGVLLVPLQREFGWETADISSAFALRLVLFGLLGPFAAAFMNRFGVRRMVTIALFIIVAGLAASLTMTHIWQLVLFWGVVMGVGTGLTAMVLAATVATRWFSHRRGLVLGMLAASSATGQLIFLPALAAITESYGWRTTIALVCAGLAAAAVAVFWLMRDRPADMGLPLYGDTQLSPPPAAPGGLGTLLMLPLRVLNDAARTPVFWVLFATFFVCGASTNGLIQTHFVTLCGDFGIVPVGAASVLALMGAFDFVGTIGSGWLSDRYDNRWLLFWYYGLRGLSLLYLPFTGFTFYGLSLFAVFYGLDWIATVPPTVKLTAERFGPERANVVFGWIFAGHQLGAASAAYGAGLSRTVLASYLPAFFVSGALCLLAAALVLSLAKPRRAKPQVQPA